jgi:hypothetical protein
VTSKARNFLGPFSACLDVRFCHSLALVLLKKDEILEPSSKYQWSSTFKIGASDKKTTLLKLVK